MTHVALTHRAAGANEITVHLMRGDSNERPSITDRFHAVRKGDTTQVSLSLN